MYRIVKILILTFNPINKDDLADQIQHLHRNFHGTYAVWNGEMLPSHSHFYANNFLVFPLKISKSQNYLSI